MMVHDGCLPHQVGFSGYAHTLRMWSVHGCRASTWWCVCCCDLPLDRGVNICVEMLLQRTYEYCTELNHTVLCVVCLLHSSDSRTHAHTCTTARVAPTYHLDRSPRDASHSYAVCKTLQQLQSVESAVIVRCGFSTYTVHVRPLAELPCLHR